MTSSYEQARDELASVVAQLESGGLSLDESLTLWERGEHLAGGLQPDGARGVVGARPPHIRRQVQEGLAVGEGQRGVPVGRGPVHDPAPSRRAAARSPRSRGAGPEARPRASRSTGPSRRGRCRSRS